MSYIQYEIMHIGAFLWFLIGAAVIPAIIFFDFLKARKTKQGDHHE